MENNLKCPKCCSPIAESIAPCNRPLLKAAPEMLEALEVIENKINNYLLEFVKEGTYYVPLKLSELMAIKDAIAKAKGESDG